MVVDALLIAGYCVTQQQVSNQYVDVVTQACVPHDAMKQQALRTYLTLLLSIITHSDHWSIEPAQVPQQITQHAASWYHMALEAAQRNMMTIATSKKMDREFAPPIAVFNVEANIVGRSDRLLRSQTMADLFVDTEMAPGLVHALQSVGYIVELQQVDKKYAGEVAQFCEPDDLVKRQAILAFTHNYVQNYVALRSLKPDWE